MRKYKWDYEQTFRVLNTVTSRMIVLSNQTANHDRTDAKFNEQIKKEIAGAIAALSNIEQLLPNAIATNNNSRAIANFEDDLTP